MDESPDLQTVFAFNITLLSGIADKRIFHEFATVKREDFLGPPPWYRPARPDGGEETSSSDLAFIYEDVVIALDRTQDINNGAPGLHAHCLAALDIEPGQDVLHIGAGAGYYSAILAELTGDEGRVFAVEIDPGRAASAKENLAPWKQVEVQARSGTSGPLPEADIVYVNAGAASPCQPWLEALRPGGKLLFPLQFASGFSAILLVKKPVDGANFKTRFFRRVEAWEARFVIRANFIHCQDLPATTDRSPELLAAFEDDSWTKVRHIYFDNKPDKSCWFRGDGWWLGK